MCIYIYIQYIYILIQATQLLRSPSTRFPNPTQPKTHLMIDVWSHFITGCHCFLLQLQLPFSHMPRLSRTHQSGGHHNKNTRRRKVTRSTGEPFGNLLEGHRVIGDFCFGTSAAFIRGIYNGPQASYQIDLPLHMVPKKRNTIKILSFNRTTIGKKNGIFHSEGYPRFCVPPILSSEKKNTTFRPFFGGKPFSYETYEANLTPSLVEKTSTTWRFRILRIRG